MHQQESYMDWKSLLHIHNLRLGPYSIPCKMHLEHEWMTLPSTTNQTVITIQSGYDLHHIQGILFVLVDQKRLLFHARGEMV